jgi:hypothetical protein
MRKEYKLGVEALRNDIANNKHKSGSPTTPTTPSSPSPSKTNNSTGSPITPTDLDSMTMEELVNHCQHVLYGNLRTAGTLWLNLQSQLGRLNPPHNAVTVNPGIANGTLKADDIEKSIRLVILGSDRSPNYVGLKGIAKLTIDLDDLSKAIEGFEKTQARDEQRVASETDPTLLGTLRRGLADIEKQLKTARDEHSKTKKTVEKITKDLLAKVGNLDNPL